MRIYQIIFPWNINEKSCLPLVAAEPEFNMSHVVEGEGADVGAMVRTHPQLAM